MARTIDVRRPLREAVQQFDSTRADELIGVKTQLVANGSTGGSAVEADPESNLHRSDEQTSPHAFTGVDLTEEATPLIEHTFKRSAASSVVVTVTLDQAIDGNVSYTLDTAGAAITVAPRLVAGTPAWELKSTLGTVTAVP